MCVPSSSYLQIFNEYVCIKFTVVSAVESIVFNDTFSYYDYVALMVGE